MFQKLFGGAKKNDSVLSSNTNRTVDAIQKLAETAELLERRKEVLEKKINAELLKAKEFLKVGNKTGASLALKRKKMWEQQLEALDNNILRVTEQQQMLEGAQTHIQTVSAMQHAAKAHKATMSEFKVEKVDRIMEEIQDAADQTAEIQQAMSQPLGISAGIDEDEIENELAELEAAQLDAELLEPAPVPSRLPATKEKLELPNVPSVVPAKAAKSTEDELAELERELA